MGRAVASTRQDNHLSRDTRLATYQSAGLFHFRAPAHTGSARPAASMKTRREHRLHDPRAIPSSCSRQGSATVAQPARHCAWTHARWTKTEPFRT